MSNTSKLLIGLLLLLQIGIIVWSTYYQKDNRNPFEKKLDAYLANPEKVKILDFQNMSLDDLPEEILQFQNVEVINLSHNYFEKIPSALYYLPNLKRLNMSNNQLQKVSLRKFERITHLDFSRNNIMTINGQSSLETVKNVNLSYNRLLDFPYFRVDLDTLNMSHNDLSNFKKINTKLYQTIQYLDLSNNQFNNFDDARLIIDNCHALNLSDNRLANNTKLPSTLFSEKNITEKLFLNNCGFNQIDILPASQLKVLDLGNNNLKIGNELVHQLKLEYLNLENQDLNNINLFNLNLKELVIIDVSSAGVLVLPNLEVLHTSKNNIYNLPDFPNLKTCYLYKTLNEKIDEIIFQIKYPSANLQYVII